MISSEFYPNDDGPLPKNLLEICFSFLVDKIIEHIQSGIYNYTTFNNIKHGFHCFISNKNDCQYYKIETDYCLGKTVRKKAWGMSCFIKNYMNDMTHGKYINIGLYGSITLGNFKNGKPHGKWYEEHFDQLTNIEQGYYKNGVKVGKWYNIKDTDTYSVNTKTGKIKILNEYECKKIWKPDRQKIGQFCIDEFGEDRIGINRKFGELLSDSDIEEDEEKIN
jgi:hypothetical protein